MRLYSKLSLAKRYHSSPPYKPTAAARLFFATAEFHKFLFQMLFFLCLFRSFQDCGGNQAVNNCTRNHWPGGVAHGNFAVNDVRHINTWSAAPDWFRASNHGCSGPRRGESNPQCSRLPPGGTSVLNPKHRPPKRLTCSGDP